MTNPICPKTGTAMHRDVRPMTLTYKGKKITFDMPGWYCDQSDESIHTSKDMKVSDRMLNRLKARSEGLLEPEAIRRIRKKLHLTQEFAGRVVGGGPRALPKIRMRRPVTESGYQQCLDFARSQPRGVGRAQSTAWQWRRAPVLQHDEPR